MSIADTAIGSRMAQSARDRRGTQVRGPERLSGRASMLFVLTSCGVFWIGAVALAARLL